MPRFLIVAPHLTMAELETRYRAARVGGSPGLSRRAPGTIRPFRIVYSQGDSRSTRGSPPGSRLRWITDS
ncbi:MAG: hypothetical protein M3R06_02535 [Chloroflexota bacterium]|nr:hypothetical protein [Chloroflexota bacterium]MDQ3221879.1 hypothetical protein [Gemmatimonadota bacterium]